MALSTVVSKAIQIEVNLDTEQLFSKRTLPYTGYDGGVIFASEFSSTSSCFTKAKRLFAAGIVSSLRTVALRLLFMHILTKFGSGSRRTRYTRNVHQVLPSVQHSVIS